MQLRWSRLFRFYVNFIWSQKKKAFVVGTNVSAISQLLNSFEEYYAYDVAWIKTSPIWILAYVGGNSLIGSTEIMSQKNQPSDEQKKWPPNNRVCMRWPPSKNCEWTSRMAGQGSNDIERSLRVNASHHFVVCKYASALMCAPSSKCLSSLLS